MKKAMLCIVLLVMVSAPAFGAQNSEWEELMLKAGEYDYEKKEYKTALDLYTKASNIAVRDYGTISIEAHTTFQSITRLCEVLGYYDRALGGAEITLYISNKLPEYKLTSMNFIMDTHTYAKMLYKNGKVTEAIIMYRQSLDASKQTGKWWICVYSACELADILEKHGGSTSEIISVREVCKKNKQQFMELKNTNKK